MWDIAENVFKNILLTFNSLKLHNERFCRTLYIYITTIIIIYAYTNEIDNEFYFTAEINTQNVNILYFNINIFLCIYFIFVLPNS